MPRKLNQRVICLAVAMGLVWSGAVFYGAQDTATKQKTDVKKPKKTTPDVIFVPTPQPVVDKMLELAKLKKGETVYDLGCGDGRIVVTAAKLGAKARDSTSTPSESPNPKRTSKRTKSKRWSRSSMPTSSSWT